MFFKTAYDTTACSGYKLNTTIDALNIALVNYDITRIDDYNIYTLYGNTVTSNAVPAFANPILMNYNKEDILVIDVRSFGRYDSQTAEFKIQNKPDYTLALNRAKLNSVWLSERSSLLQTVSSIPMTIFASWISESIGRRFALNPKEQFDLGILAAIFYNSQFNNEEELDERNKLRIINTITRNLRASAQDVITILDKTNNIRNVTDFCKNAEIVTESIRLRELSPGILFTILGGTWFGTNAKEMVAIATEHPPTWIAILMAAFNERTYKNSVIVKITERSSYSKLGNDFLRSVLNLIKE